jgi:SAM-dependent methyltransferase
MPFISDRYTDECAVCGTTQAFECADHRIRESYRCNSCKALLREREQARCILLSYADARTKSLADLAATADFQKLCIYEPGTIGSFRKFLKPLSGYMQSDYYPEGKRQAAPKNIPHQDLQRLTFDSGSFDLVITSDIIEHVRRPIEAFREIARILKPGGMHIFTVPLQMPMPSKTIMRVDTAGDEDKHLLPEHYHGDGKGGKSLVYNDFGADIVDMLKIAGFHANLVRPETASVIVNSIITVVARKS